MNEIRPAKLEDSAGIARVQVDSYRTAYRSILPDDYLAGFTYDEQEQDWRDLITSQNDDLLMVAENKRGEIVGYALGRVGTSKINPFDCELVALHVCHAHHRQGIGGGLITRVARELKHQGCTSLMLWVLEKNPARGFYERLGGRVIGKQGVKLGDDVTTTEVAYGWLDINQLCITSGQARE
jgi:GNAT superfamily N-acetyltransferase